MTNVWRPCLLGGEDGRSREWLSTGLDCAQLYLTLCDPLDCSPPDSSVHVILQARILEWVAISSPRGSSQPRDRTQVSCVSYTGRRISYPWATWEAWLYNTTPKISVFHCCAVTKLCPTLCDPMDFNASDFPVTWNALETSFSHSQNPSISIPPWWLWPHPCSPYIN